MTPEFWKRLKDVFTEALEKQGAERDEFLSAACEDDHELLRVVGGLLKGHERAGEFLSSPAVMLSGEDQPLLFQDDQLVAGRFRIVRFLARGGMGEVYEAEDLVLRQRVALKTVQSALASEETIELLKHEIQSARCVTHPNVCRTYDIAEHGGSVMLLTMELLDGPTLSQRLRESGPFTREEALPVIEQIAAGLQAAHNAGIVHGDFKAGNVILTCGPKAWRPVITDFGLALSPHSRQHGSTLRAGTPGYMAPEQVDGQPATPATDIYAFGIVIAAMTGARRSFTGRDVWSNEVVEDWKKLGPWRPVVGRCLARDPAKRYQRPSEVAAALRGQGRRIWMTAAMLAVALTAILLHVRLNEAPSRSGFVMRKVADELAQDMFWHVSPDGRWLAASDWNDGQLVLRDLRGGNMRRITNQRTPEGSVWNAVFSPDGDRIVYIWQSEQARELRTVNADGSNDRALLLDESVAQAVPVAWSPDGSRIAMRTIWRDGRRGLGLVRVDTGQVTELSISDAARRAGRAVFSPSGDKLVFDAPQGAEPRVGDIFAVALGGNDERRVVASPSDDYLVGLSPSGDRIVFVSDRSGSYGMWAVVFGPDLSTRNPVFVLASSGAIDPLGITEGGSVYYKVNLDFSRVYTAKLDLEAGSTASTPREIGLGSFPSWSRDGSTLAFISGKDQDGPTLVFTARATGATHEVRVAMSSLQRPQWRARGRLAGYGMSRGKVGYFEVDAHTGAAKLLASRETVETGVNEGAWSPDGNIFFNRFADYRRGIYRYDLRTKNRQVTFVPTPAMDLVQENLALSPDGQTLAFQSRSRPGRQVSTLMLMPAAGGEPRALWAVERPYTFAYGAFAWLPDSSGLLVSRSRGYQGASELWLVPVSGASPRKVDFPFSRHIAGLHLNADGKTIAFHSGEGERTELRILDNVLAAH